MRQIVFYFSILFSLSLTSCGITEFGNHYDLKNGIYKIPKGQKVLVHEHGDHIDIYNFEADTVGEKLYAFDDELENKTDLPEELLIVKNSFDIDLSTIPIKLRFAQQNVPTQLVGELNGALFLGFRKDIHKIKYEKNYFNQYVRKGTNTGFAIGIISGFSGSKIDETVTNFNIEGEYEGLLWMYGINTIIGWNAFSFGIAIGQDMLLDSNRKYWVYNHKPWIGISLGINLN